MSLYGSPQIGSRQWDPAGGLTPAQMAGLNLTTLMPGESIKLFDGTEAAGASVKSVAIARSRGVAGYAPVTFSIDFPSSPTDSLLIQGANFDVEGDYQTLYTSTNKQHDVYTDTGAWLFYRATLSSYSAGSMPIVAAQG